MHAPLKHAALKRRSERDRLLIEGNGLIAMTQAPVQIGVGREPEVRCSKLRRRPRSLQPHQRGLFF